MLNIVNSNIVRKIKLTLTGTMLIFLLITLINKVDAHQITSTAGNIDNNLSVSYPQRVFINRGISFEELRNSEYLFCVERGAPLPSERSNSQPLKDQTVNSQGGINVLVKKLDSSNSKLRNPIYSYTKTDPNAKNPYGTNDSVVTTSRTEPIYSSTGERQLRPAEAYVLAHKKSTSGYPDYVQRALWDVLKYYGEGSGSGIDPEETEVDLARAANLAKEAINFDKNVKAIEQFKSSHNGNTLVDLTNYNNVTVSYNKNTSKILVGPFKIDYVRGVYVPSPAGQSQMVNKDGVVSYSEITGAKLYADGDKTQEIVNWQFIYSQVNGGKRTALKEGDDKYRYPYPNEEFYVEIDDNSNKNINTVGGLTWDYAEMNAEGKATNLNGSFQDIEWIAKDYEIKCTNRLAICQHGSIAPHSTGPYSMCTNQVYCYQHRNHRVGDGHLVGHDFYIEARVTNSSVHAQNIIALPGANITTPHTIMDMPAGLDYNEPFWPLENEPPVYPPVYPPVDPPVYPPVDPPVDPPKPPIDPPKPPINPPTGPVIPLTFKLAGKVWLDNLTGKESMANGIMDATEPGIANVEVYLYKKGESAPIAKTLTDSNGNYSFGYNRVGYEYYIDFIYDGMTYRSTSYLYTPLTEAAGTTIPGVNDTYKNNTDKYLKASHAVENIAERIAFNNKFYTITNNMATGTTGIKTPLRYNTVSTDTGKVSSLITTDATGVALPEFKLSSRTSTTGLYFPLNDRYHIDDVDKDLRQVGSSYYYIKTYEGLNNINLGLVKREQGDFAVKVDVYQTILTMKNDIKTYKYNTKTTDNSTFDVDTRTKTYYDKIYTQEVDPMDYTWRYDTSYGKYSDISKTVYSQKDELNVYLEYKFLIRNQATLQYGYVKDLINYFDKDLEYSTKYDFASMTSWVEKNPANAGSSYKQEIIWETATGQNGGNAIHTDDLKDMKLESGETLEVHLILKVKKNASRSVILNPDKKELYTNVLEITSYGFNEGVIDRDSNPGNVIVGKTSTYEDDTDSAPNMKIVLEQDYLLGNAITGYVWEDLKQPELTLNNNHFTGNGLKDKDEKKINNVKVELLEVLQNKETGKEVEILVREGIRTGDSIKAVHPVTKKETINKLENGQYMFANLPTGTYKVKFTYGDEYQITKDVTYNGQDYKSVSTDTLTQQYNNSNMEVMVLLDTSKTMQYDGRNTKYTTAAKELVNKLYDRVQKIKVGVSLFTEPNSTSTASTGLKEKPSKASLIQFLDQNRQNAGGSLANAIANAMSTFSKGNTPKAIIILTDGYMTETANDKKAIENAKKAGIKVISVVCSIDEWPKTVFGTWEAPTAGKLYYVNSKNINYYVTEVALEDALFEIEKTLPNLTDAKDVQDVYKIDQSSVVGDIHSRKANIEYTDQMIYENASIVDGADSTDKSKFAQNTQMTAITPTRVITLSNDNNRTSEVNLGLIERPKMELQIKQKVAGIQVKLANGEVIIDTTKGMSQNVQIIPNEKFSIYMDDEILQGATVTVLYKITVVNNGQVDTLGEYFDYDMFNATDVAKYTSTVPTKIGTLYSYFDNLMFRGEDNTKWQIEENTVKLDNTKFVSGKISNAKDFIKNGRENTDKIESIETKTKDGKAILLPYTALWEFKNNIPVADDVQDKIAKKLVQVAQTNSLKNTELFPVISKEVQSGNMLTSVSTYIQYSKVLSANDSNDTLSYNTAVEIVERLHDLGRRDYIGVTGNYMPYQEITEYDSAKAENIVILNPLGNGTIYYALTAGAIIILAGGIIFIRKRVL